MAERLRAAAPAAVWAAVLGAACGPVLGTSWWLLAPPITFVVRDDGVYAAPGAPIDWFGMDGWFLVLGLGFGMLLGLAGFWFRGEHPVSVLLGMTAGALVAAGLAWWVGHLLGPASLATQAEAAAVGERIQGPVDLLAHGVLVVPAAVAVAVFGALVASSPVAPSTATPSPLGPSPLSPSEPERPSAPR